MTNAEKLNVVRTYIGADPNATDALISVYLDDAEEAILNRRFPFGIPDGESVPSCYERLQCRLAYEMYLRRGAEGETDHNEDGVSRKYASADYEEILRNVIQIAKVARQ
jgi:hypothetical protein